jgi:hypothetical protein
MKAAIPVLCLAILALLATILAAVAVASADLAAIWPVSWRILALAAATAAAEIGLAADAAASYALAATNCAFKLAIYNFNLFSCAVFFARSASSLWSSASSLVLSASVDFCYCSFLAFASVFSFSFF